MPEFIRDASAALDERLFEFSQERLVGDLKKVKHMSEKRDFHMTPDEFRRYGRAVVDWIADYYARIESLPVLSQVKPGQVRESLPGSAPTKGERHSRPS